MMVLKTDVTFLRCCRTLLKWKFPHLTCRVVVILVLLTGNLCQITEGRLLNLEIPQSLSSNLNQIAFGKALNHIFLLSLPEDQCQIAEAEGLVTMIPLLMVIYWMQISPSLTEVKQSSHWRKYTVLFLSKFGGSVCKLAISLQAV